MSSTPDPSFGVRIPVRLRRAMNAFADVLFPPGCIGCHGLVESSEFRYLCESCARRIVSVSAPHCTTCGYPFYGALAETLECHHCIELRPRFDEGRTATLLQGPMRRLVHAIKYERAMHLLRDVAALVFRNEYFTSFLCDTVLVPVPLHPRKRRERGFNQAELLAGVFAEVVPEVRVASILERVVDTPTQTRLDRKSRQANLKNAFALHPGVEVISKQRYVLIDDVFTTGATLNACATVLRRAGLKHIDAATLGHG